MGILFNSVIFLSQIIILVKCTNQNTYTENEDLSLCHKIDQQSAIFSSELQVGYPIYQHFLSVDVPVSSFGLAPVIELHFHIEGDVLDYRTEISLVLNNDSITSVRIIEDGYNIYYIEGYTGDYSSIEAIRFKKTVWFSRGFYISIELARLYTPE